MILEMAADVPFEFIRWGARAILEWRGCEELPCPVFHVHGRRDRIIPCRAVKADVRVDGGGHVVNLTHGSEVNSAIARFASSL
jgi:pimeloyl-ACP methyl ester carboxylesterase